MMDDFLTRLEAIVQGLKDEFPGPGAKDRIAQLDAHAGTVRMVIEALYEESSRMEGYK